MHIFENTISDIFHPLTPNPFEKDFIHEQEDDDDEIEMDSQQKLSPDNGSNYSKKRLIDKCEDCQLIYNLFNYDQDDNIPYEDKPRMIVIPLQKFLDKIKTGRSSTFYIFELEDYVWNIVDAYHLYRRIVKESKFEKKCRECSYDLKIH